MVDKDFKKNFMKGSVAAAIGTIASMAFHFLSIMLLTRSIDKNSFGIYALILVVVNFFNIVGSWGLNITLVKFISNENKLENKAALRAILVLRVIHLSALTVIFYLFSDFILKLFSLNISTFNIWIPVLFITSSFRDLFFNVLQGLNAYKRYSIVQVISAAIRVIVIVAFIYLKMLTLQNLILIEVFTTAAAIIVQLAVVPFRKLINYKPTREIYKEIIRFSTPVYANNLLTFAYDRVSFFIIGMMLNPISVALYDVANKIPDALQKMFTSFMIVYFPNAAKLFSKGEKKEALFLMNKSINVFSMLLSGMVFISFLFSKEITILLFSSKYIETAPALALLMLNLYLRIMSNIKGYSIVGNGYSSVPVKVNIVASIINIGLTFLLIPYYGFMGAVYAVLIMNIVSQAYYHWYLIKLEMHPDGIKYLIPMFFVILFGIIPELFSLSSIPIKIMLVLIYVIMNWMFVEEFKNITKKLLNKIGSFSSKIRLKFSF